jgi:hypothetical protein
MWNDCIGSNQDIDYLDTHHRLIFYRLLCILVLCNESESLLQTRQNRHAMRLLRPISANSHHDGIQFHRRGPGYCSDSLNPTFLSQPTVLSSINAIRMKNCQKQIYAGNSTQYSTKRWFGNRSTGTVFLSRFILLLLSLFLCQCNAMTITSDFWMATSTQLIPRAQTTNAGASASSAAASATDTPTAITLPQPFDTSLGSNFTAPSCPQFFKTFLNDKDFITCYPFSLLLQVR